MTIPQNSPPVVHLLTDAADGGDAHPEIDLKHATPAVLRALLIALIGVPAGPNNVPPAVPGLIELWGKAKSNKTAKSAALRSAKSNGRALAQACVNSLKPALGQQWNSAWNAAGFLNNSIAIPDNPAQTLLGLRGFYASNPTREVKNVNGIDCTADACQAAADVIEKAETAYKESASDLVKAHTSMKTGLTDARTGLSNLQAELKQLIADDDPRWLAFGFEMPGHHASPEVPVHLIVTPGLAGSLYVHCDDARRAATYRFKVLDAADGKTVIAEQLVHDPQFTFEHLASGKNVLVIVSAYNATGESQPCAPVAAVVP